jgi:two-component system sensor histidine kinase AtoS
MTEPAKPERPLEPAESSPMPPPSGVVEAQELVADLLPHMAAGIAVLAVDLTVSSWNPRAESITGYTLEEITTLGLARIFEPVEVMQHVLRKVQYGIPTLSEYLHLRHADGQLVPVVVQCSPQRHLGQTASQAVVVFRELEFLQKHLRRNEHLHMLGRLAGSLSHEIRNPLNAAFLHVDVLEEELQQLTPDRPQMAESLIEIRTEITRLNDLVQDYLSLARLSDLRRVPMELGMMVETLALEMQEQLDARGIMLHLEGLGDLGQVALQHVFRRVLLNLVQNAIDAMPQGGILTIRGQREEAQVRLEISDTGSGIPADQFPLLFTPFHTTKSEGTGLGLYVVQQVVAAHEGEVAVSSEPGRGTTFTITLPLATSEASSRA